MNIYNYSDVELKWNSTVKIRTAVSSECNNKIGWTNFPAFEVKILIGNKSQTLKNRIFFHVAEQNVDQNDNYMDEFLMMSCIVAFQLNSMN